MRGVVEDVLSFGEVDGDVEGYKVRVVRMLRENEVMDLFGVIE